MGDNSIRNQGLSVGLRPLSPPSVVRGKLAFENVTFRYPTRLEVAALNDFSLTVEQGETVAVGGRRLTFFFPTMDRAPRLKVEGDAVVVGDQRVRFADGRIVFSNPGR